MCVYIFQLDYMQVMLQDLMLLLASETAVEKSAENQAVTIDEDDDIERAKLPEYMTRFKVSLLTEVFGHKDL